MQNEAIFNRIFSRYGGRMTAEHPIPVELRNGINENIQSVKEIYPDLPFIYVDFIQSDVLNLHSVEEAKDIEHPPSSIRIAMIVGNILDVFHSYSMNIDIERLANIVTDSLMAAEKAFVQVTSQEQQRDLFKKSFEDPLRSYKLDIVKNWNKVRPLIEPFSYCELPPLN